VPQQCLHHCEGFWLDFCHIIGDWAGEGNSLTHHRVLGHLLLTHHRVLGHLFLTYNSVLSHLFSLPPRHPVSLLGVGVKVVQPGHPDAADGTAVGLLPRVDPLVDLVLPLVIKFFVALSTLMEELALVLVLAVFPLVAVLIPRPTHGTDVSWLVPVNGSDVIFNVVLVLCFNITARLGTLKPNIPVHDPQVHIQCLMTLDECPTYVTWDHRGFMCTLHMLSEIL